MNKTEMKSEFKSKANSAGKTASDSATHSASEVLDTVTEFGKNFINSMSDSREKALEAAATTLSSLDKTVRTRPMAFVGGAAVLGLIAGYFLGRARTPSTSSALQAGVDKIKNQIEKNINKVSEHLQ